MMRPGGSPTVASFTDIRYDICNFDSSIFAACNNFFGSHSSSNSKKCGGLSKISTFLKPAWAIISKAFSGSCLIKEILQVESLYLSIFSFLYSFSFIGKDSGESGLRPKTLSGLVFTIVLTSSSEIPISNNNDIN